MKGSLMYNQPDPYLVALLWSPTELFNGFLNKLIKVIITFFHKQTTKTSTNEYRYYKENGDVWQR